MIRRPSWLTALVLLGLSLGIAPVAAPVPSARAQGIRHGDVASRQASRSELEALATAAEQAASSANVSAELRERKRAEAAALRARLHDGDFRPGDRIVLSVREDSTLTDTFTVSATRMLDLPNQQVALHGVLRSELLDYLTIHIARFVKTPEVDVRPVIRLAILGEVTRPGYYLITPDHLVSDAIMVAGGPTREADLGRTTVRRGPTLLWGAEEVRAAVIDGATLDQLSLRSGDEIVVGETRRRNWDTVLRNASLISGIALSIYGATRIF